MTVRLQFWRRSDQTFRWKGEVKSSFEISLRLEREAAPEGSTDGVEGLSGRSGKALAVEGRRNA